MNVQEQRRRKHHSTETWNGAVRRQTLELHSSEGHKCVQINEVALLCLLTSLLCQLDHFDPDNTEVDKNKKLNVVSFECIAQPFGPWVTSSPMCRLKLLQAD